MRVRGVVGAALVLVSLLGSASPAAARPSQPPTVLVADPVACPGCWHPALKVSWQWQLQNPPKAGALLDVKMYDVDGFEASKSLIAAMHSKGIKAVCYISAGSWEKYRPDANDFPASVLGRSNGWPGEKWLDIRKRKILKPIMRARMDICRRKGFDAIEFDNVDGYQNATGFPLTGAGPAPVQRLPRERRARARAVGVPEERPRADPEAAAVLRCGAQRAVLPVLGMSRAQPVREGGQAGVQRRVQARSVAVLRQGEREELQLAQEAFGAGRVAPPVSRRLGAPVLAERRVRAIPGRQGESLVGDRPLRRPDPDRSTRRRGRWWPGDRC